MERLQKFVVAEIVSVRGVLGPLELDEKLAPAPYTTSFTGTTVSGVAKMDVVNGKLRIVQDPDVTINVEGLNVQMENLFGGEADGLAKVVLRWGFSFAFLYIYHPPSLWHQPFAFFTQSTHDHKQISATNKEEQQKIDSTQLFLERTTTHVPKRLFWLAPLHPELNLRFVNKESDKFIKDFQPEIAKWESYI